MTGHNQLRLDYIENDLTRTNIIIIRPVPAVVTAGSDFNRCGGSLRIILHKKQCTWGADKSLARPGRKQSTATEDFEFHVSYL
jgi:hypothetical protein